MAKKKPTKIALTASELRETEALVALFSRNEERLGIIMNTLLTHLAGSSELQKNVHSMKWRLKDASHLKDKLLRKRLEMKALGAKFEITEENLFTKINDLIGFRILHLYTEQIRGIDASLKKIFEEAPYKLIEGPIAKTWDDESRDFFTTNGIETEVSHLYTSVHYVIETSSRTPFTCEIQVRTLMEEVWGEVDHKINYPHKTRHLPCREQLAALARVTSGCTRLVDSIFRSYDDLELQALKSRNAIAKLKR